MENVNALSSTTVASSQQQQQQNHHQLLSSSSLSVSASSSISAPPITTAVTTSTGSSVDVGTTVSSVIVQGGNNNTTAAQQQQQQQQQQQSSIDNECSGIGGGDLAGNISDSIHHQQQQQQQQHQQQHQLRTLSALQAAAAAAASVNIGSCSGSINSPPLPTSSSLATIKTIAKTFGRNNNGTMVQTSTPSNEAELQLYRVLQRASLLAYYDTLLEMGGDDVQQLCDAGEEEFLEIMALVGMASKPLHVRRLQKALHEWAMNPSSFQTPLSSLDSTTSHSTAAFSPEPAAQSRSPFSISQTFSPSSLSGGGGCSAASGGGGGGGGGGGISGSSGGGNSGSSSGIGGGSSNLASFETLTNLAASSHQHHHLHQHQHQPHHQLHHHSAIPLTSSTPTSQLATTSTSLTTTPASANINSLNPSLTEHQMARLAIAAEEFSRSVPPLEPKPHNSKKRSSKDLEQVLSMNECDPRRMDEIRKYAAIYGRFDCKRRPEKPLSVHELCVNEAASQICKCIPPLLFDRAKLFHYARQVVRDSGLGPSAAISQYDIQCSQRNVGIGIGSGGGSGGSGNINDQSSKRMRMACDSATTDFNKETAEEMRHNLLAIYQKLGKTFDMSDAAKFSSNYSRFEYDDNDSRYSFSNSSSPHLQSINGGDQDMNNSVETVDDDNKHTALELSKSSSQSSDLNLSVPSISGGNQHHQNNHHHSSHNHHQQQQHHPQQSIAGNGVHIISAAGNHIIAVANPALAMSTALSSMESHMSAVVSTTNLSSSSPPSGDGNGNGDGILPLMTSIKRERLSPGPTDA